MRITEISFMMLAFTLLRFIVPLLLTIGLGTLLQRATASRGTR